jgi:hypothetical protein
MPEPLKILSAVILVCERFLHEVDAVFSAVRMVDVSYVPPNLPKNAVVEVNVLVIIKSLERGSVALGMKFINPNGEEHRLQGIMERLELTSRFPDEPAIPGGVTLGLHVNMRPEPLGTHYLVVELDGVEAARAAITFKPQPSADTQK